MIQYAGVVLDAALPEVSEWVRTACADVWEWDRRMWPGRNLTGVPFVAPPPERDTLTDVLVWPVDASRWAYAHFVVDEGQLDAIRAAVYGTAGLTYAAASLVMQTSALSTDTGYSALTTTMWALPPRPLQQIGADGLYLLTLVDDRYFWWDCAASVTCVGGTTSWATLYANIAAALSTPAAAGITLTVDTVPSAYLKPPSSLGTRYESLPLLLDAVAYCVGQRIVRQLDGTVRAWNVTASQTNLATLVAGLDDTPPTPDKVSGGTFQLGGTFLFKTTPALGGVGLDYPAVLPASVTVAFPNTVSGVLQAAPYTSTKTLTGLALTEFGSLAGQTNLAKFFRASTIALEAGPTNAAELSALAVQIATDFYRYQGSNVSLSLIGYPSWTLDGLLDCAEYHHRFGELACLRLSPPPWNDVVEELLYYGTGGAASGLTRLAAGSGMTITETGDEKASFAASGGSLTVEEVDGSPSYSSVTTLQFDQADGFVVSQPAANKAKAKLSDFVASGASHAPGKVPDPGAVAGTAKFLREDATWVAPGASSITFSDSILYAPTTIILTTGDQIDVSITITGPVIYFTLAGDCNLFSLDLTTANTFFYFVNTSSFTLTVKPDDGATGTAAKRFTTPGSVDVVVQPGGHGYFWRDNTTSRWRTAPPSVQPGGKLTGKLTFPAGTTSRPPINLPPGSAPTSPSDGDTWVTTVGIFIRVNSVTYNLLLVGTNALLDGANHTDTAAGAVVLGDLIAGSAVPKWARLAGNTTATKKFLSQTGTGAISAVPSWVALTSADVGLGNVENTALSTWAGSANIVTLGTITTGTWHGTAIDLSSYATGAIPSGSMPAQTTGTLGETIASLPATGGYVRKWTVAYTDFSTGGTSKTVNVVIVPAGTIVKGWKVKASTAFSGGAIATYVATLGTTGSAAGLMPSFDIKQAVGANVYRDKGQNDETTTTPLFSHTGTTQITITAQCSGANLSVATQGSLDVWLELVAWV